LFTLVAKLAAVLYIKLCVTYTFFKQWQLSNQIKQAQWPEFETCVKTRKTNISLDL
jgi:hypothetical protein